MLSKSSLMSLVGALVRHDDDHEGHGDCHVAEMIVGAPLEALPLKVNDDLAQKLATLVGICPNDRGDLQMLGVFDFVE